MVAEAAVKISNALSSASSIAVPSRSKSARASLSGGKIGVGPSPRATGGRGTARTTVAAGAVHSRRSEEHTSELQSLMRISYAVFCLKKKNTRIQQHILHTDRTHK